MQLENMVSQELMYRKKLKYPPYYRVTFIRVSSLKKQQAKESARWLAQKIRDKQWKSLECLGEAPAPLFRLKSRYRYQLLLKSPSSHTMQMACQHIFDWISKIPASVRVHINRDG